MTHAMAAYTWCEWEYGVPIPPTNSALGVTLPESKLGRVFLAKGRNADEVRLVRIVRNDSGVVLAKRKLVRYDVGAGDYLKSIAGVTNADAGPVAGMVEEGYDSGVKIGHWFRLVVFCQNIGAILADANSARIALNPGDRIVCNTNGEFWKESITDPTDAPATADVLREDLVDTVLPSIKNSIFNKVGKAHEITTNIAANRGAVKNIELNLI
jgi:hypothetical protein